MPRAQARMRALRRLTKKIDDILFNKEFIDTIIDMRARLGIDINKLKQVNHVIFEGDNSLVVNPRSVYGRNGAFIQFLRKRRLISEYSARALSLFRIYSSGGRFWQVVGESYNLDVPDYFEFPPYEYVVAGLCFDITKYIKKYEKDDFCKLTNRLLEVTVEKK